jgi:carboxypeptidase C (cathepsin A)
MKSVLSMLALVAGASAAGVEYTPQQLKQEITNLPGLAKQPSFKMFSGYIPVDGAATREIFYWFVEAETSPETAPVVLWTNGGPGCSGLGGFMTEQGPFRPNADGTLKTNAYAWNTKANMIFIEQPAGVGFSTAPADFVDYNDNQAAEDNYNFVVGWFKAYPQFAKSSFYASSESYGGHYMPTLARDIVQKGGVDNYKGFLVGNPLTYMPYRDYGMYGNYGYHQLISKPMFDKYLADGCDKDDSSSECQDVQSQMDELTQNMDPYALDFPVCAQAGGAIGRENRAQFLRTLQRTGRHQLEGYFPDDYEACAENWGATYLNRADVQAAIGVKGNVTWAMCSDHVGSNYNTTDVVAPVMDIYKFLIDSGKKLDILVYSGDDDAVCSTLGSQQWIWDLGYKVTKEWAPWTYEKQTAGFGVQFDGFSFVTVHGAGHMVPQTRPAQALQVFSDYLDGHLTSTL